MTSSTLTGSDNYFEDFVPGKTFRHARGKTVEVSEHVMITNLVMNTAHGHFNGDAMQTSLFGQRMAFGGYTASLVLGLASQDTAENVVRELGLDRIRFPAPVFGGDTLYAYSEVVSAEAVGGEDAGVVVFRHWGVNQDDKIVFSGERRALVRKRPHAQV